MYKKMYYILFNAITDGLEALGRLDVPEAVRLLELSLPPFGGGF